MSGTQGSANKDGVNQGSANKGIVNKGFVNQDSSNQGSTNQDSRNQGSANQDSSNQGSANQDSRNQGSANQASVNKGIVNQGSTSRDTDNRDYANQVRANQHNSNLGIANQDGANQCSTNQGNVTQTSENKGNNSKATEETTVGNRNTKAKEDQAVGNSNTKATDGTTVGNRNTKAKENQAVSNRNSSYLETCLDSDFTSSQLKSDSIRFVKVDPSKLSSSNNNGKKENPVKQDLTVKESGGNNVQNNSVVPVVQKEKIDVKQNDAHKRSESFENRKNIDARRESREKLVEKSSVKGKTDVLKSSGSQKSNVDKINDREAGYNKVFGGKDRTKMPIGRPGFLPGSNYVDSLDVKNPKEVKKRKSPDKPPNIINKSKVESSTSSEQKKSHESEKRNVPSSSLTEPENAREGKVIKEKKKSKFLSSLKMKGIMKRKDKGLKNAPGTVVDASLKSKVVPELAVISGGTTSKANSTDELDSNEVDSGVGEDTTAVGAGEEEDYDEVFDGDCDDLVEDDDDVDSYDGGTYRIMMKTSYDVAIGATPLTLSTGLTEQILKIDEPINVPEITTISDYTIIEDPAASIHSKDHRLSACAAQESVISVSSAANDEARSITAASSVEEGVIMHKAVIHQAIGKTARNVPGTSNISEGDAQHGQKSFIVKEANISIIKPEPSDQILNSVKSSFTTNSQIGCDSIRNNYDTKLRKVDLTHRLNDNLDISKKCVLSDNESSSLKQLTTPETTKESSAISNELSEERVKSQDPTSLQSNVLTFEPPDKTAHCSGMKQKSSSPGMDCTQTPTANNNYADDFPHIETHTLEKLTTTSDNTSSFILPSFPFDKTQTLEADTSLTVSKSNTSNIELSQHPTNVALVHNSNVANYSESVAATDLEMGNSANSSDLKKTKGFFKTPIINPLDGAKVNRPVTLNITSSDSLGTAAPNPLDSTKPNRPVTLNIKGSNALETIALNLMDKSLLVVPEQPYTLSPDGSSSNGSRVPANTPTSDDDPLPWSGALVQELTTTSAPLTPVFEVRAVNAFSKAVARQNKQFVSAIQSLDALNDRIVEFVFDEWEGSTYSRGVPPDDRSAGGRSSLVSFAPPSAVRDDNAEDNIRQRTLHASLELMRQLLLEAQYTFRSMVEENQQLASRIDGDLQTAQDQVTALRQDLQDTKSKICQFQSSNASTPASQSSSAPRTPINHSKIPSSSRLSSTTTTSPKFGVNSKIPINVSKSFPGVAGADAVGNPNKERSLSADGRRKSKSEENGDLSREDSDHSSGTASSEQLRRENDLLSGRNKALATELEQLKKTSAQIQQVNRKISSVSNASNASSASSVGSKSTAGTADKNGSDDTGTEEATSKLSAPATTTTAATSTLEGGSTDNNRVTQLATELSHAKEALSALKADRKRLKTEKVDLLQQMKQLYATLEDKEAELRDFIRNFEQRMAESESSLQQMRMEREAGERERWGLLHRLGEQGEKTDKLAHQLQNRDAQIHMLRKQLSHLGYQIEVDSIKTTSNGITNPTISTTTSSNNTTSTTSTTPTTPTTNNMTPLPTTTNTTPNGRGSSADSGVRLSSDRDSTASHEGGPGTPPKEPTIIYATPHLHNNSLTANASTVPPPPPTVAPPNGSIHKNASTILNHHQLQNSTNPYQTTSLYSTSPPNNVYSTYSSNSSTHNPYATSPQLNNLAVHMNNLPVQLNHHDTNPYSSSSLYSGAREDPVLMGTPRSLGGLGSLGSSQSEGGDYSGTLGHPMGNTLYSNSNTPCSERSGSMAGGLSQSTEQLCDRVAEAAESALQQHPQTILSLPGGHPQGFLQHPVPGVPINQVGIPKPRGATMTLSRKTQKSLGGVGGSGGGGGGGTWGSISRVFARQKKRAALDASIYDGSGASSSEELPS